MKTRTKSHVHGNIFIEKETREIYEKFKFILKKENY